MAIEHVPFLDLGVQTSSIKAEIIEKISGVIDTSSFILGQEVSEFERRFAAVAGTKFAFGVGNGTDALILALRALEIGHGDEVITVANTFVATVEAIAHVGAAPVLVDMDEATYNVSPDQIRNAISTRTKAIIPVHLYGQPANMQPIMALAQEFGLKVIEDAAQAHGALYDGQPVGSLGNIGCFSFYPGKNLGAFGDGGAVVTDDENIAARLGSLRDHGSKRKYEHELVGYNSRLDSIQAAVLNVKLPYLAGWNTSRQQNAQCYGELLSEIPGVIIPYCHPSATHVYHLYVIRIISRNRDQVMRHLQGYGVDTGIHYPIPVHLTKAFKSLGYSRGSFPSAEEASTQILSLPMYPELAEDQIQFVVDKIKDCII